MDTISQTFKWRGLTLLSQVSESRHLIQHNGLFGENTEGLLAGTLRDYLDEQWAIGSGEIIDVDGQRSPQCDIIIYNPCLLPVPFRSVTGKVIIPAHAVGSVIEVKSSLTVGDSDKTTSVSGLCEQMLRLNDFLRKAIQKGNDLLLARKQHALAEQFLKPHSEISVMGFAFSASAKSETLQSHINDCLKDSDPLLRIYILDVKRDSETLKSQFSAIGQSPNKETILQFAEEVRLPNGYVFTPEEYTERDGGKIAKTYRHVVASRPKEFLLQQFISETYEVLNTISPGRINTSSDQLVELYKAYNSWLK